MKQFAIITVLALCSLTASLTAWAQSAVKVQVEYPGMQQQALTLNYPQPVRLNTVLQDATNDLSAEQFSAINWSLGRLGSDKLTDKFNQRRRELEQRLNDLELFWQQRGYHNYRSGVNYLRRQLNELQYAPAYYMGLDYDRTKLRLQSNPILSQADGNTFYLRLPAGTATRLDIGLDQASAASSANFAYSVAKNGDIARIPVALYNRHETPVCFYHSAHQPLQNQAGERCKNAINTEQFYLLHQHALPQGYQDLNQRIAEILKFAIGDAQ